MLQESLRFLFILIIVFFILSLVVFLVSFGDLSTRYMLEQVSSNKTLDTLRLYLEMFKELSGGIYLLGFLVSIVFYSCSARMKVVTTVAKTLVISLIAGLIFVLAAMLIPAIKKSGETRAIVSKDQQIEKLYQTSSALNMNGHVMYYSVYQKNPGIFHNVVLVASKALKEKTIYSSKAVLDKEKQKLKLLSPHIIEQGKLIPMPAKSYKPKEKKATQNNSVTLDMSRFISRVKMKELNLGHFKTVNEWVDKALSYVPLSNYLKTANTRMDGLRNMIHGKDKLTKAHWINLTNFLLELIALIIISLSLGILLYNNTVPIYNTLAAIAITIGLLALLSNFYPLPAKAISWASSGLSFMPDIISGLALLIVSAVTLALAIVKYRLIKV
ncbi:MAG: hypothetical protein OEZ36_09740 [Spirochaetota bacterium]|nr:hypothetical protein [Spirochaetota bacterium]